MKKLFLALFAFLLSSCATLSSEGEKELQGQVSSYRAIVMQYKYIWWCFLQ